MHCIAFISLCNKTQPHVLCFQCKTFMTDKILMKSLIDLQSAFKDELQCSLYVASCYLQSLQGDCIVSDTHATKLLQLDLWAETGGWWGSKRFALFILQTLVMSFFTTIPWAFIQDFMKPFHSTRDVCDVFITIPAQWNYEEFHRAKCEKTSDPKKV